MSTTVVIAGLGIATIGIVGRAIVKYAPSIAKEVELKLASLPKSTSAFSDAKYYKGGFEAKMNRREAALILGVSPNATKNKIKDAHKRIMVINHPDRGGSPYLASKINEGNARHYCFKKTPKNIRIGSRRKKNYKTN